MNEMKVQEEIANALDVLRRHGLGGRHLYVPKTAAVKGTKLEAMEMLAKSARVSEIVDKTGFTASYVYFLKKELEKK